MNNRRVPKQKWVPLEIELPKARGGKPPRERNNNNITTSKRREADNENEYYSHEREIRSNRRYRGTSYRSGNSSTRPINTISNTRLGSNSDRPINTSRSTGAPSNPSVKRGGGSIRSGAGIQKPRPHRVVNHHPQQNGEFTVDYSIVKEIVTTGAAGIKAAPPFLMPYMGTYYYNGVPSYANMDTSSLKEAIRKQM